MAAPIRPNHAHGNLAEPDDPPVAQGRFARMFMKGPMPPDDAKLNALGVTMFRAADDAADSGDDSPIPAGYTYLAQFIDHDLTFDPISSLKRKNDVEDLIDFRSPRFDLDSLYGTGPEDNPYLYAPDDKARLRLMLLGRVLGTHPDGPPKDKTPRDVPRTTPPDVTITTPIWSPPGGRAIVGDPRNDENVIIAQLHALFLRFHNRIAKEMPDAPIEDVRNLVRWHYQWVVLRDFLPRVIDPDIYNSILPHVAAKTDPATDPPRTPNYKLKEGQGPYVPVEFSDAAFRFGHSMVRGAYTLNSGGPGVGGPFPIMGTDLRNTLVGLRAFQDTWVIDWSFFFEGVKGDATRPQRALKIGTYLAEPLAHLPQGVITGTQVSLAQRDLIRGAKMQLPSGQEIAVKLNENLAADEKFRVLTDDELFSGTRAALKKDFAGNAPLWYYVLAEAEILGRDGKLGPVGSRLVMETMVGLMKADPTSILNSQSKFQPRYLNPAGKFGMTELITVATGGDVSRAAQV